MGELTDFITGQHLPDTHDERYRQGIARLLVNERGYRRADIQPRVPIDLQVDTKSARIRLDFIVRNKDRIVLLVKYAPGSLVTRHQVAFAAARLLAPYAIPFSLVTNGEDAHWLDNADRTLKSQGLHGIWDRHTLEKHLQGRPFPRVNRKQSEMAARILLAYEVDGRCPCDDTVCEFESP
ncbi:MAG: type I restriction enzyme HsdR N-terminal domain-containing protein [Desulfosarcina sp.]|nr:type I restriction enzyme HsdR N-terminal domain-containing protein [Desulfobacterales bacterium]